MTMFRINLISVLLILPLISAENGIVNKKIDRTINIASQLVKIKTSILIESTDNKPINKYKFLIDDEEGKHLSYIEANLPNEHQNLQIQRDGNTFQLSSPVDLTSKTLDIITVYTKLLKPFPEEITQSESQLVLYTGNFYSLSAYLTKTQTTKVQLPSAGNLESYGKLNPFLYSTKERTITYGPYANIAPNTISKLTIHVENNSPFLLVSSLDRKIELSLWSGVISVDETVDLVHHGAKLKGSFSRFEFQRESANALSAVRKFTTRLPADAFDVYYRDDIGNISTSNVRKARNAVLAELRPRFPLFGGWKTHYVLGYYIPTSKYLFNEGSEFLLRMPLIGHIYDTSVIDEAKVSIILPEGVSNIRLRLPYPAKREKNQVHKTYLDTVGRTVVVLRLKNLVEKHIQEFELQFTFNKIYMLQEPLLLIIAIFLLCLTVIIYVRLDFSLGKNVIPALVEKVTLKPQNRTQKKPFTK